MVKQYLILFLFFQLLIPSQFLCAEGIEFMQGTWADALSEAKKANKLILIWAYKPGCGACKMMTQDVFPNEEVGKFYNSKFINFSLDTQKEPGASIFAKFEGIKDPATPTFYFIDPNNETLLLKHVGTKDVDDFIDFGKQAIELPSKFADYKAGKMALEDKIGFWLLLEGGNKDITKDVLAYFKTIPDETLLDYNHFKLMTYYALTPESREFKFYMAHLEEFKDKVGVNLEWYYSIVFETVYERGVKNKDKESVLKFAESYKLCAETESEYQRFIEYTKERLDADIE